MIRITEDELYSVGDNKHTGTKKPRNTQAPRTMVRSWLTMYMFTLLYKMASILYDYSKFMVNTKLRSVQINRDFDN